MNIHPTKLEIKFQEEQKVFKAIYHAIKDNLLKENLVKNITINKETNKNEIKLEIENKKDIKTNSFINLFKKRIPEEMFIKNEGENSIEELYTRKNEKVIENINTENKNIEIQKEKLKTPTEEQIDNINNILMPQTKTKEIKKEEQTKKTSDQNQGKVKNIVAEFENMYTKMFGKDIKTKKDGKNANELKTINENIKIEQIKNETNMKNYKYIGTAFLTYIIIEVQNELYIIDQHAAHERIMYEKIKENFYGSSNKDSQIMLLPDVINLSYKEKQIVKENEEIFEKAGFIYEDFGDNTIKLIGVPGLCIELETKDLFLELLDQIDTVAITAKQEKEEKLISTMACKSAVKANMNLSKEEIDNLLKNLLELENPFTCPHRKTNRNKIN